MKKSIIILIIVFTMIITIIAYFQFFHSSEKVEKQVFVLYKTFNEHSSFMRTAKFSPDGKYIASGSVDSSILIWDKLTTKVIHRLKHPEGVTYLDYSPDGTVIASSSYDGIIRIWSVQQGILLREIKAHDLPVWSVNISPDGKSVAAAGEKGMVKVWEVSTGNMIMDFKGHTLNVWSVKFSPDEKHLATGSFDNTLKIWNIADGKLIGSINAHTEAIVDLGFTHSGNQIATASDDSKMKLWNAKTGELIRTFENPEHIQAIAFSPEDKYVLTGGRDKTMAGELLQNFFGNSEYNPGVSARLWDTNTGELLQTFSTHTNDVNDVDFSSDGKWIITASEDHTVQVWQKKH